MHHCFAVRFLMAREEQQHPVFAVEFIPYLALVDGNVDQVRITKENVISRNSGQKDQWLSAALRDTSRVGQDRIQKSDSDIHPPEPHFLRPARNDVSPKEHQKSALPIEKVAHRAITGQRDVAGVPIEAFFSFSEPCPPCASSLH